MIRLNKRIDALEGEGTEQQAKVKEALKAGRISTDDYEFYLNNAGRCIPPIAWINDSPDAEAERYRKILQQAGLAPVYEWVGGGSGSHK